MATAYIAEMRNARPKGPYNLAGACLGGVVALEMAQQLRAQGEQVGLLVLIDSFFPSKPKAFRDDSIRPKLMWGLDHKIGEILLEARRGPLGYVTAFRNAFQRTFSERARARALAKVDQANAQAMATYVPKPYPGRLVLFWATDAVFRAYQDRRLAWADIAEQGLEVHVVPGNHLSIMEPPQLDVFADTLKKCLQKSRDLAFSNPPLSSAGVLNRSN
jgi:aspartate racemase